MKLTLKLPGGRYLEFEKKPMGENARMDILLATMSLSAIISIPLMIWILR